MEKNELIATLQNHYDDKAPIEVNDEQWTLADLFARQWLNNGWDGFGMVNVEEMYNLLCEHSEMLVEENMISERGFNDFGFPLWEDFDFGHAKGEE